MGIPTSEQKDTILDLQAKLKFLENQLNDLQTKKSDAIKIEENKAKTAMQLVCDIYDSQIATAKTDIDNLKVQLGDIK